MLFMGLLLIVLEEKINNWLMDVAETLLERTEIPQRNGKNEKLKNVCYRMWWFKTWSPRFCEKNPWKSDMHVIKIIIWKTERVQKV